MFESGYFSFEVFLVIPIIISDSNYRTKSKIFLLIFILVSIVYNL